MTAKQMQQTWGQWQSDHYEEAEQIGAQFCIKAVHNGFAAAEAWLAGEIAIRLNLPYREVLANIEKLNQ